MSYININTLDLIVNILLILAIFSLIITIGILWRRTTT